MVVAAAGDVRDIAWDVKLVPRMELVAGVVGRIAFDCAGDVVDIGRS